MTLNRRVDSIFPGMGVGVRNDSVYLQAGLALSGSAQQTFPIPATGTLSPTTTAGRIRFKIYNPGGTSPTLTDVLVKFSDSTNSIIFLPSIVHPNVAIAITATQWVEMEFEYIVDVATSGAGGGASGQLSSVIGGANLIQVLITLGGTSPTASMDLELVPLI